jgi:hypothetical protein
VAVDLATMSCRLEVFSKAAADAMINFAAGWTPGTNDGHKYSEAREVVT